MKKKAEDLDGERRALCAELPLLEARLRKCGLYVTAARLRTAVESVGWEAVGDLAGLRHYERLKAGTARWARTTKTRRAEACGGGGHDG